MLDEHRPIGWARTRLGEIIPKARPKTPADPESVLPFIGMDHIEPETFVLTGQARFAEMKSAGSYFMPGDVLYGRLRPYLNKVHKAKFEGVASAEFIVLPSAPHFDADFIRFLLHRRDFVDFAMTRSSGDRPRVKFDGIADYEFALPPLSEQQRIVEKIETLFAELDKGEEALREVQRQLARYRQSVLKAAVNGELTADWRAGTRESAENGKELLARILDLRREHWQGQGKYSEAQAPNDLDPPELPDGWAWVSVDQILRTDLANGKSVPDADAGFPVLRLTALNGGEIDLRERKIGRWDAKAASRFLVKQHDILVSRGNGSKRLVGAGGMVRETPDAVAYPDTMIRISLLQEVIDASWFVHIWNGPRFREQIEASAKSTAGIYKISQGDIRSFQLAVPPLGEQRTIAARLDEVAAEIERASELCDVELKRSAALRQSILKHAFSGKLVPQDPSEEPADELLARIRAERSAASKSWKKARA